MGESNIPRGARWGIPICDEGKESEEEKRTVPGQNGNE